MNETREQPSPKDIGGTGSVASQPENTRGAADAGQRARPDPVTEKEESAVPIPAIGGPQPGSGV